MRKVLSFSAWLFSCSAVALGIGHAWTSIEPVTIFLSISGGLFTAGLLAGIFINRTPVFLSFCSSITVGCLVFALALPSDTDQQRLLTELLFSISQVSLVGSLASVVRQRWGSRLQQVTADGLIIAIGAWLISWVVLVRPSIAASASSPLTITRGVTVAMAMVVVFLLALLLFSDSRPTMSSAFMGLAVGLNIVAIMLRALANRGDTNLSLHTAHTPLIMSFAFAGSAFLHPSSRSIVSAGVQRISPPLMTRLVSTTSLLVIPILVVALTDSDGTQDRVVRTVSAGVLAVAAMSRIIQSVRANARTQEQLIRNALTDSLTGLPNRILMLQHIEDAIAMSHHSGKLPTVLFIDVDRFKNINDSLGHATGDDVLTHVSRRLLAAIPDTATVGRIAGDEFVVLQPDVGSSTQAVVLAEHILDAFRDPIIAADGDMFVTASIGVAYAPKGVPLTADDLMRHADTAMYRAKDAGRNCIALFDDTMIESVTKRLEVETALYRALERNELLLMHQPIVDVNLGVVVGFEALMRWDRGEAGMVSPVDFIPIAEETGTIVPLGSWAINDSLQQLRRWIDTDVVSPATTMSVNVSPRQLHDPQFVTVVSDALKASGIPAEQLWLEVTETIMITEPAQALSSLQRLNTLGVRIAIDDFGTGYSSLSLLQQFPIQCIKIDRAFVQHLVEEKGSHSLVRTIIAMADALMADVVAEGIENPEQLAILKSLNCQKAQGYYISKPVSVTDVPRTVAQIHESNLWRTNS